MAKDFFTQLRGFAWRGISVPIINTRLVLRQDLAPHRFVGRPGADIEATGRAPIEIMAEIPFFNDIAPGPRESWKRGRLYPTTFRQFLAAMADTSTGILSHPELGDIKCKPRSFEPTWDGKTRGGVPCSASWLETTEDPSAFAQLVAAVSPVAGAIEAAQDLDASLGKITPPFETVTIPPAPSFNDMMRSVQGVFDQVTLMQQRYAGVLNNIVYRVDNIINAMNAASKASSNSSLLVTYWPLRDACSRMKSSATDLKKALLAGPRPIGIYMPGSIATMAKIAGDIPASIVDIMKLNPSLLAAPVVPANSAVRYYLDS